MDVGLRAPVREHRARIGTSRRRGGLAVELVTRTGLREGLLVAGLLAAAVALSLPALGPSSLWLDDTWIALVHRVTQPSQLLDVGLTAPGFALLLKATFVVAGFSEETAQLIPFLAGVAVPPAVYLVGRRIGLRLPAALLAAVVMLVSPVRIEYAARVKPFAIDALTVTILVWLAWRAARAPARHGWATLTGVAMGATVLSTSVVPAAAAAVTGAALAVRRTPHRWRAVAWALGYLAGAGAWVLAVVSPRIRPELREYWAGRYIEGPADLWRIVRTFASDLIALEHGVAVAVLAGALLAGFAVAARRRPWLAIVLGGPVLLAAGLAVVGKAPLGTGRTDLYLFPAVALAIGWAVQQVPWRPFPAVVAIAGVAVVAAVPPVAGYPAEEFAPLTAVLERGLAQDDVALLTASTVYGVALYGPWTDGVEPAATTTGFTPVFEDDRIRRAPGSGRLHRLPDQLAAVPSGGRAWLFTSRTSDEAGEELRGALAAAGWRLEARWTSEGAALDRWTRSLGAAVSR